MLSLVLAAIFFAGIHLGVAGTTWRDRAIAALGEVPRGVLDCLFGRHHVARDGLQIYAVRRHLGDSGVVETDRDHTYASRLSPGATENDPQPWTEYVWKHVRGRLRQGHSSSPSYIVFQAANHFCELHRSEIPNLDPYVKLARQRLQSAVTMAMQVGPPFAHIPPGPEGIVAQNEVHAIDTHLGISWMLSQPSQP